MAPVANNSSSLKGKGGGKTQEIMPTNTSTNNSINSPVKTLPAISPITANRGFSSNPPLASLPTAQERKRALLHQADNAKAYLALDNGPPILPDLPDSLAATRQELPKLYALDTSGKRRGKSDVYAFRPDGTSWTYNNNVKNKGLLDSAPSDKQTWGIYNLSPSSPPPPSPELGYENGRSASTSGDEDEWRENVEDQQSACGEDKEKGEDKGKYKEGDRDKYKEEGKDKYKEEDNDKYTEEDKDKYEGEGKDKHKEEIKDKHKEESKDKDEGDEEMETEEEDEYAALNLLRRRYDEWKAAYPILKVESKTTTFVSHGSRKKFVLQTGTSSILLRRKETFPTSTSHGSANSTAKTPYLSRSRIDHVAPSKTDRNEHPSAATSTLSRPRLDPDAESYFPPPAFIDIDRLFPRIAPASAHVTAPAPRLPPGLEASIAERLWSAAEARFRVTAPALHLPLHHPDVQRYIRVESAIASFIQRALDIDSETEMEDGPRAGMLPPVGFEYAARQTAV